MEAKELERLCQKYAVSVAQCNKTLDMIIKTQLASNRSVSQPRAFIIGGQPGAGKSNLQRLAAEETGGNLVIVDADHLRDYHPYAREILRDHEKEYSPLTNQFAYTLYEGLTEHCRKQRLNYAMESTFKSSDYINDSVRGLKNAGYAVEIKLLAVDPQLSLLGTRMRYEIAKHVRGYGRYVGEEFHDYCCQNIRHSVRGVQANAAYDQLTIYARSSVVDGSSMDMGVVAMAQNPGDAFGAYDVEVSRRWPEPLYQNVREKCEMVMGLMEKRSAPKEDIDAFRKHLEVTTSGHRNSLARRL